MDWLAGAPPAFDDVSGFSGDGVKRPLFAPSREGGRPTDLPADGGGVRE